jgi:hypothetical protein
MSIVLDKGLEPLGNKARKGLKEARFDSHQNEEKIRGPCIVVTHGIHLPQEGHCSQLSMVYCQRLAAHL